MFECDLTPSRLASHRAHIERRAAISARSVRDDGIDLKRKQKKEVIEIKVEEVKPQPIVVGATAPVISSIEQGMRDWLAVATKLERQDKVRPGLTIRIKKLTAKRFNMECADIECKIRTRNYVIPRHVGMFLCRELTKKSLPEIGRIFGGLDHTSVLYAHRTMPARMFSDADLCQRVVELRIDLEREILDWRGA